MKFRFEDFLKNILPGMVVFMGIVFLYVGYPFDFASIEQKIPTNAKELSEIILLLFLVISYLLGYFNDAFGSWGEHYVIYRIWGTPSYKLLNGKGKRIKMVQTRQVIEYLLQKEGVAVAQLDAAYNACVAALDKGRAAEFFKLANELKDENDKSSILSKIDDFYYSYIFSRNLFFSSIFCFISVTIACRHDLNWIFEAVFLLIIVVLGFRRRDQSLYYSRSILLGCRF